eukprot:gene15033-17784_t
MFRQILLISMVCLAIASAQQCRDYSCVVEGGACTTDMYQSLERKVSFEENQQATCMSGLVCKENPAYGNNGAGHVAPEICVKMAFAGEGCEFNTCAPGLYCHHVEEGAPATCQNFGFAAVGEDCDSDYQCISQGEELECSLEGVCRAVLPGKAIDFPLYECTSTIQCAPNQYCNMTLGAEVSNCLPRATVGQACDGDVQCESNLLCDLLNAEGNLTCITPFSKAKDAICSSSNQNKGSFPPVSPCNAAEGLFCSGNVCASLPTFTPVATNCTVDACIPGMETCACNAPGSNTGQCYSTVATNFATCQAASLAYVNCVQKEQCQSAVDFFNDGSCAMDECRSEFCDAQSACVNPTAPGTCYDKDDGVTAIGICGKINSSASVRPFVALVIAMAFIVAMF